MPRDCVNAVVVYRDLPWPAIRQAVSPASHDNMLEVFFFFGKGSLEVVAVNLIPRSVASAIVEEVCSCMLSTLTHFHCNSAIAIFYPYPRDWFAVDTESQASPLILSEPFLTMSGVQFDYLPMALDHSLPPAALSGTTWPRSTSTSVLTPASACHHIIVGFNE